MQHKLLPFYGLMAQAAAKMDDPAPVNVQDARPAIQSRAALPKQLNAAAITAFFHGDQAAKDDAKVAAADKGRMSWMLGLMFKTEKAGDAVKYEPVVDFATVKTATAEYVKGIAEQVGYKGGKGAPKPPKPVLSARKRAAEIKSIYGATRFVAYDPSGKGYHAAVAGAVDALDANGIKPDGTRKPDDATKKRDALARREAGKINAAGKAAGELAAKLGRPLNDEERAALVADAEAQYLKESAMNIAADILKRWGIAVAEQVAAIMPQAIQEFEAQKEPQPQPQ